MEYEIVTLKEKIAVGIAARTNNLSPNPGAVIGGLWNRFYQEGIYASIPNKVNEKALGIYTAYDGDEKADYTAIVACETAAAWQQIWQMQLPRTFQCDFEEYQDDQMDNAEIHIYVGLTEAASASVESRCGLLCSACEYREQMNCKGCIQIDKPFWGDSCPVKACCEEKRLEHCGQCEQFPCTILHGFAYDEKQGDQGKRIEQCKCWKQEAGAQSDPAK